MPDKKMSLLIVEDNPGDIRLVREMLSEEKGTSYRIETAETLKDGLSILHSKDFDTVLLDLGLPDSKGLETVQHFLTKGLTVPVIVFTSLDDIDLGTQAVGLGAQDYLVKGQITKDGLVQAMRYAIERKRIENELNRYKDNLEEMVEARTLEIQKREERFRRMAETMHDGLTIIESGKPVFINDRMCEIVGYPREELLIMSEVDYAAPEEKNRLAEILEGFQKKDTFRAGLEFWIVRRNGDRRYIHNRYSAGHGGPSGFGQFIMTTDMTDRKRVEEENKKRLMKFQLEDGNLYLTKERQPTLAHDAFNDLLKVGYEGIAISRSDRDELHRDISYNFTLAWLGECNASRKLAMLKGTEDFEELLGILGQRSAVLIDRLDYLILNNGIEATLGFVYRLRDIAYFRQMVVILSLDPATVSQGDLKQLEKEALEILPKKGLRLGEEMLEILEIISNKQKEGSPPSYSDIGTEMEVSRPTIRKKVHSLVQGDYVVEVQRGNRKMLELTKKGRDQLIG